ncbi:MAG: NAD(+)/NADH kinase [Clostridia bacterium]|nr:NAD(+)/NADH kinase [Clostridia bacterium]
MYGIIANPTKAGATELQARLISMMDARNMRCKVFEEPEDILSYGDAISMLIVIGGDGSILRYAEAASERDIPILGVNVGHIGFLAEIAPDRIEDMLLRLQQRDYRFEERMMLTCSVNGGPVRRSLNDVLVYKRSFSGVTRMEVRIDGKSLGTVFCDGMVAATPTGSTGYCLSAGGPVLVPEMRAIALAPVCSHTLHMKPTVSGASAEIEFILEADGIVCIDGEHTYDVTNNDVVRVSGAERGVRFVRFGESNIFRLIAEKLV